MSGSVTLTTLLLFAALLRRFLATRAPPRPGEPATRVDRALDGVVFAGTASLFIVGSWIALLGLSGAATPAWVSAGAVVAAIGAWKSPRRPASSIPSSPPASNPPAGWRAWAPHALALFVVLGALALRSPPIESPLAGRDQGTYTLRAQHLHASGSHALRDPVLQWATEHAEADVLALWPQPAARPWREDRYEQGYRPGFYVADRETGRVVPQFLHLHPSVLTLGAWLFGPAHLHAIMLLLAGLSLIALWRVACLVFDRRDFATATLAIVGVLPQCVWTHRLTLSEGLAGLLILAATLAWLRRSAAASRDRWFGVGCLVALAGVRGEAWLLVPCVLVAASMGGLPKRHALAGLTGVWIWVSLHASSSFPYVHDELVRLHEGWSTATPLRIAAAHALGTLLAAALVWLPHPRLIRRLVAAAPRLALVLATLLFASRLISGQSGPPFARLDAAVPVLGPALLVLALVGLVFAWPSWTARRDPRSIAMAMAWIPALSALAFVRPNLPNVHLYTYGRYLVPALVPGAALLAMAMAAKIAGPRTPKPSVRALVGYALALSVIAPPLLVYAKTPETRLDDHRGAGRLIDALAEATPQGAVILAGGEGPHARHAFNHVGGALALAHGRTVLPFRDDEKAYAAALALLPEFETVYLLHDAQGPTVEINGETTVGVDAFALPGLETRVVGLYTLMTHRVTPTVGSIPTRITRDAMHLALIEIRRAPGASTGLADCDGRRRQLGASERARMVALRVGPSAAAGEVAHWKAFASSPAGRRPLHKTSPGAAKGPRRTLGPWVLGAGEALELRGEGVCDEALEITAQQRLLPAPPSDASLPHPTVFEPPRTLGHAVGSVRWRVARSFGPHRRPLDASPQSRGVGLVLEPGTPLSFAPVPAPSGSVELVVWLDDVEVEGEGDATIEVEVGDGWSWRRVARLSPEAGARWSSDPIAFSLPTPHTALRLRSVGPRATLRAATIFAAPERSPVSPSP